ncbi:MAG TPA: hypothetical protein DCE42_02635 [Myxococcales bacterium]|nr:hypothetical protein [Deltaproteobacteria bacterium]MBU53342.1 hypothetical protein [Deltaproteobacteria bacterium]HAA53622.1 hypothetical protein [Myxococcales bacterium]|tara:strand:+ start:590 stop:1645 length:1056 start_codon:yes stop_codon:yes gene_type:complete
MSATHTNIPFLQYTEEEAKAAYIALLPRLKQLPKSKRARLRYNPEESTRRGLWIAFFATQDRPLFMEYYRNPPLESIDFLRQSALAVVGAALTHTPEQIECKVEDLQRAKEIRRRYVAQCKAIFFGERAIEQRLHKIGKARQNVALGQELIELASFLQEPEHWERIGPTGLLLERDVEECEALGERIVQWASQVNVPASEFPREMERRAWSLFVEAYQSVRDHAAVIFREQTNRWHFCYPSLFTHKHSRFFPVPNELLDRWDAILGEASPSESALAETNTSTEEEQIPKITMSQIPQKTTRNKIQREEQKEVRRIVIHGDSRRSKQEERTPRAKTERSFLAYHRVISVPWE